MKPVRRLDAPPPGLCAWRAEEPDEADWDGFRAHRSGKSYKELHCALAGRQHGLCGYRGMDIPAEHRQVEHVVPQGDPECGAARALDATNMMAWRLGGTLSMTCEQEQYMPPVRENMSCGQKKANDAIPGFVDPRALPEMQPLTRVTSDGRIEADEGACIAAGWEADRISRTVEFPGLNVERLRLARAQRWQALEDVWENDYDDEEKMRAAACEDLLPENDRLRRFFTTSRSYFSAWGGEEVLSEEPQEWI